MTIEARFEEQLDRRVHLPWDWQWLALHAAFWTSQAFKKRLRDAERMRLRVTSTLSSRREKP